ncbi:MAG: GspE/PulE family protein [Gammaproteobacteria bacterium]|nr:GspE/PulE family protein [Gammaproteobacteria bacterium]
MDIRNPNFIRSIAKKKILSIENINRLRKRYGEGDHRILNINDYHVLQHIINKRLISADDAGTLWADGFNTTWMNPLETLFQEKILSRLPEKFCRKHNIILVYQFGGRITAAMANPFDKKIIQQAEKITQCRISPICAFLEDVQDAITLHFSNFETLHELSEQSKLGLSHESQLNELTQKEWFKIIEHPETQTLLKTLLLLAVRENSSDIHLEPFTDEIKVRFRIDGVLHQRVNPSSIVYRLLSARIKQLCKMNPLETDKPQDGSMTLPLYRNFMEFRISCLPMVHGEKIVIRILTRRSGADLINLKDQQLSKPIYKALKEAIQAPNGLILLAGPSSSDKKGTLFSALQTLNLNTLNVCSIEDPVQYRLPNINQLQVNNATDINYSSALHHILQQDPDIVLIEQLKDAETARLATQAALADHLILATIPAGDAISALKHLIEMGVEPFMVSSSVNIVIAQRQVRRLCKECKTTYNPTINEVSKYFIPDNKPIIFYQGSGCSSCNQTGYKGRIALHEMLLVTKEIRDLVTRNESIETIYQAALQNNYQPIRYDGLKKVLRGLTSIEELERVTSSLD